MSCCIHGAPTRFPPAQMTACAGNSVFQSERSERRLRAQYGSIRSHGPSAPAPRQFDVIVEPEIMVPHAHQFSGLPLFLRVCWCDSGCTNAGGFTEIEDRAGANPDRAPRSAKLIVWTPIRPYLPDFIADRHPPKVQHSAL